MTASRSTSPMDQFAFAIKSISDKVTALERAYARLPFLTQAEVDARIPIVGEPLWLTPVEGDALFLTQAEGDTRYANVSGDSFSGLVIVDLAAGGESIRIGGTGPNPFLSIYNGAADRKGYVQGLDATDHLRIGADGGLQFHVAGALRGTWESTGLDIATTLLGSQVRGFGNPGLIASGVGSGYIGLYNGATDRFTLGTRTGYIGQTGSSGAGIWIVPEETNGGVRIYSDGTGSIEMYPAGVYQSRFNGTTFLVGKSTSGIANVGAEVFDTGTYYSTRGDTTNGILVNKIHAAGVGSGSFYIVFAINSGTIGSITRNALTSAVLYNTTSHGPWKGNVVDLDDREAIDRVMRWRPVAFQWKYDDEGNLSEDGTPSGDVQHGFIAQEMEQVNPDAVSPQVGTEAEHREWLAKCAEYDRVSKLRDELTAQHDAARADWAQRNERAQAEAVARHERQIADYRVRLAKGGKPKPPLDHPVFEAIPQPVPPTLPELPEHPGHDPFQPAGGDWSALVADLSAAVQALVRENRTMRAEIDELKARRN